MPAWNHWQTLTNWEYYPDGYYWGKYAVLKSTQIIGNSGIGRFHLWSPAQLPQQWLLDDTPLQWCHNGHGGVSNHHPHDCLLNIYLGTDQRKHQSSTSLAFVRGIHQWPVNSPHKGPVTLKMFPFDDVIMPCYNNRTYFCLGKHNKQCAYLTHWGRDKMAAISQTIFSNAFSWMKMDEFRLRFHWSLFLRVQLTIFQHWFR